MDFSAIDMSGLQSITEQELKIDVPPTTNQSNRPDLVGSASYDSNNPSMHILQRMGSRTPQPQNKRQQSYTHTTNSGYPSHAHTDSRSYSFSYHDSEYTADNSPTQSDISIPVLSAMSNSAIRRYSNSSTRSQSRSHTIGEVLQKLQSRRDSLPWRDTESILYRNGPNSRYQSGSKSQTQSQIRRATMQPQSQTKSKVRRATLQPQMQPKVRHKNGAKLKNGAHQSSNGVSESVPQYPSQQKTRRSITKPNPPLGSQSQPVGATANGNGAQKRRLSKLKSKKTKNHISVPRIKGFSVKGGFFTKHIQFRVFLANRDEEIMRTLDDFAWLYQKFMERHSKTSYVPGLEALATHNNNKLGKIEAKQQCTNLQSFLVAIHKYKYLTEDESLTFFLMSSIEPGSLGKSKFF